MHINSRLPNVGTTIFTVMSQLAAEYDALNLSQGFPDFAPPSELVEAVHKHMKMGHNQYAPMIGVPELRAAIRNKVLTCYQAEVNEDSDITVTSGATEALFCAITAVVHPGDEVILFDPAYDSYVPAIILAGGTPVRLALNTPNYSIDWQQVASHINPKTRLIIINSPHNPTGSTLNKEDLQQLAKVTEESNIFILSDEVYEHIVFDGQQHHSVLTDPALRQRSFAVSSFGKTYHMTGWKIGYCIAPPSLSTEFRKIHQYVNFATSTPMQYAIAEFMQNSNHHNELSAFYQQKRDYFLNAIRTSKFTALPCNGTYFQLLDYSALSSSDDEIYAKELTQNNGIAAIPVSVFSKQESDDKVLRFCFAKDEKTLDQAGKILSSL